MTPILEARGLTKPYSRTQALAGLDLVAQPGWSPCWAPTAPARRPSSGPWPAPACPGAGTLSVAGIDAAPAGAGAAADRPGRPVRGGGGGHDRARERGNGRPPLRRRSPAGAGGRHRDPGPSAATEDADRLVRTYSGGLRRRLDLDASLVGAPRLLLLDDQPPALTPAKARVAVGRDPASSSPPGPSVLLSAVPGGGRSAHADRRHHRPRQGVAAGTPAG